jgi:UDP-N-acetylmuramate dehydrogenase
VVDLAARLRAAGVRGRLAPSLELAPHTTYRIGGPADLAILPCDAEDLARALATLAGAGAHWVVLGGGSNVLVSDLGVRGAVVLTSELRELEVRGRELVAGAGVPSHEVALAAQRAALSGAEFLAWLPGTLGGACYMNARAYGSEVAAVLACARVVERDGTLREVAPAASEFAYKRSPFRAAGAVVAQATLALVPGDPIAIGERIDHIGRERRAKHELDFPSCGCVFKNDRRIGVSSGALIESCGLKGFRIGAAQVSPHHANFVFNLGGATARDVRAVIEHVRRVVEERTSHRLETEVQLIGEWEARQ